MTETSAIAARVFQPGRYFVGTLNRGDDLITAVERFCRDQTIERAVFHVVGSVISATIGTFDPRQQVYVTAADPSAYEIACCTGSVSRVGGVPAARAQISLADEQGTATGGRLFSETIIFEGELYLQELIG